MELNSELFWSRLARLRHSWLTQRELEGSVWNGTDCVLVSMGKQSASSSGVSLSESFQRFLFEGMVMTNTVIGLFQSEIVFLSSGKKLKLLQGLSKRDSVTLFKKGSSAAKEFAKEFGDSLDLNELKDLKVDFLDLGKEYKAEALEGMIAKVKASFEGTKVGTLTREEAVGDFAAKWSSTMESAKKDKGLETVEVGTGFQAVFLKLDSTSREAIEGASGILTRIMLKGFVKAMEGALEEEEIDKTNKDLASHVEKCLNKPKETKMKLKGVREDEIEVIFPPTVQSGGVYNLDLGAASDQNKLNSDVLMCQFSVQYSEMNASIARTFLVDPSRKQRSNYKILEDAHKTLVQELTPGAVLGDVYDKVAAFVEGKDPELRKRLPKSLGCGMGLLPKFTAFRIRSGSKVVVQEGMTFYVASAISDIELDDAEKKKKRSLKTGTYSLLIGDMVTVSKDRVADKILTGAYGSNFDNINYQLEDGEEDDGEEDADVALAQSLATTERVTRSKTKTAEELAAEREMANLEVKIHEAQIALMNKKAQRALRKAARQDGQDVDDDDDEGKLADSIESLIPYKKGPKEYPRELIRNQVYCDKERDTVLVPICGYHVPFHISAIKAVTRSDEERACLLRLTFNYPTGTSTFAKDVSPAMRVVMTQYPDLNYVKEMTFRSRDMRNLSHQFRLIKEMQKRVRARIKQKQEEADLVEQADLVPLRAVSVQLPDVSMRPPPKKGKFRGRLEVHKNGFRYRINNAEFFDIIFANIKHFFFQECKKELTVLIHFHLKNPVMVGRTKTYDVQFFSEVVEASSAIDETRRNRGDPDEEREEAFQRKRKKMLNNKFKAFCTQAIQFARENDEEIGVDNDFDMPYRKLAFLGVPHKEMVTLTPTVHCLVNLTETPFFVVTLDEVEHIHFERVTNSTRNFDMVIIMKNQMTRGSSTPERITSIPMESLEVIRQWLHDKGDISFTVGSVSLNWKSVMDSVYDQIDDGVFWMEKFHDGSKKDVGWRFLNLVGDEDSEEEDEEKASRSSDSAFSESDAASEESEDEDDWDADDMEESSEEEEAESDEDGEDWDELERKAIEDDKKRNRKEQEKEEEAHREKKRKRRR